MDNIENAAPEIAQVQESLPAPEAGIEAKRHHEIQDVELQSFISDSVKVLKGAIADVGMKPVLISHGYTAAEMNRGLKLADAALTAFQGRAAAVGRLSEVTARLNVALDQSRDEYAGFRELARAVLRPRSDRQTLGVTGSVPRRTTGFVTAALASYGAAEQEPYKSRLSVRGYPAARIASLYSAAEEVAVINAAVETARTDARDFTIKRDAACEVLRLFMQEFNGSMRSGMRDKKRMQKG